MIRLTFFYKYVPDEGEFSIDSSQFTVAYSTISDDRGTIVAWLDDEARGGTGLWNVLDRYLYSDFTIKEVNA